MLGVRMNGSENDLLHKIWDDIKEVKSDMKETALLTLSFIRFDKDIFPLPKLIEMKFTKRLIKMSMSYPVAPIFAMNFE